MPRVSAIVPRADRQGLVPEEHVHQASGLVGVRDHEEVGLAAYRISPVRHHVALDAPDENVVSVERDVPSAYIHELERFGDHRQDDAVHPAVGPHLEEYPIHVGNHPLDVQIVRSATAVHALEHAFMMRDGVRHRVRIETGNQHALQIGVVDIFRLLIHELAQIVADMDQDRKGPVALRDLVQILEILVVVRVEFPDLRDIRLLVAEREPE